MLPSQILLNNFLYDLSQIPNLTDAVYYSDRRQSTVQRSQSPAGDHHARDCRVWHLLPYTPLAGPLSFIPLSPLYFLFLAGRTAIYLLLVQLVKRRLMRRYAS
jgi:hypothetical protein